MEELDPLYTYIAIEWFMSPVQNFVDIYEPNKAVLRSLCGKSRCERTFFENTTYMGFQMIDSHTLHIQSFGSKHASRECERALFFVVVQAAEVINKTLSNNQKLKIIIDACGVDPFLFFLEGFDNGEIYDDPTKAIKFKGEYAEELKDYANPRLSIYARRFIWYSKGI